MALSISGLLPFDVGAYIYKVLGVSIHGKIFLSSDAIFYGCHPLYRSLHGLWMQGHLWRGNDCGEQDFLESTICPVRIPLAVSAMGSFISSPSTSTVYRPVVEPFQKCRTVQEVLA